MTGEIALGPLRHTFTTPTNEDGFWQLCIGVLDFSVGKLNPAIGEFIYQINQLTLCCRVSFCGYGIHEDSTHRQYSVLSIHFPSRQRLAERHWLEGQRQSTRPTGHRLETWRQYQTGEGY